MPQIPKLSFCEDPGGVLRLQGAQFDSPVAGLPQRREAPPLEPKGALFDRLLAMTPLDLGDLIYDAVTHLGGLMTEPPKFDGHEVRAKVDDGFFLSAEDAAKAVCDALGIPFRLGAIDPRIPRDPFLVEVGNTRLRFVIPESRTPSLLQLARLATAGKLPPSDPVKAGEVNLHETAGQMAIRGRGLPVHCRDFGERFIERLEAADDKKQILVTGAGTNRFAHDLFYGSDRPLRSIDMARIERIVRRPNSGKPKIVAVDMAKPPEDTAHPQFRAETGLYREMSQERLLGGGPLFSDVIDMMGCLAYSPTISEDLQKTFAAMEVGGMLWVGSCDSVVIYKDDRLLLLPEWLSTIDGLKVEYTPGPATNGNYFAFSVTKTKRDIDVEPLSLLHRDEHYPRAVSTIQIFAPGA